MNGDGVYSWLDGKKYQGGYIDGVKNGHGEMTWPNGKIYRGNWVKGVQSGKGSLIDTNGETLFDGEWVNGKPQM